MIMGVCYFTEKGKCLAQKIKENFMVEERGQEDLREWTKSCFEKRMPLVYIGSCGIAVRTIAPFVADKRWDSPVLVVEEAGNYVIPILSGHLGGANKIAKELAKSLHATAVITTATDVEEQFSVDVFARENGFVVAEKEGIKKISLKILNGEQVSVFISKSIRRESDILPRALFEVKEPENADLCILSKGEYEKEAKRGKMLTLYAKEYVCGMGCKKGTGFEKLKKFLLDVSGINPEVDLYGIGSIDLKKEEVGLLMLAQFYRVPFVTYSAAELNAAEGEFEESDFVREVTGVGNVASRAATLFSENTEETGKKIARDGMTLSVLRRVPKITTWET